MSLTVGPMELIDVTPMSLPSSMVKIPRNAAAVFGLFRLKLSKIDAGYLHPLNCKMITTIRELLSCYIKKHHTYQNS